jgi:uncharacterized membrane protein
VTPAPGPPSLFPAKSPADPRDEKETGRLEAFSDGVFAIAITLLILDFHVPKPADIAALNGPFGTHGLLAALLDQWPTFAAYLTSFFSILVMWVNHHSMFTLIRRVDATFLYLNGVLLLFVAFVPYPTSLVAAYIHLPDPVAAALLSITYLGIAILYTLLWRHAADGRRLLDSAATDAAVAEIRRSYRIGPPAYLAALALAFVDRRASVLTCLALALFFSFTGSRLDRQKA